MGPFGTHTVIPSGMTIPFEKMKSLCTFRLIEAGEFEVGRQELANVKMKTPLLAEIPPMRLDSFMKLSSLRIRNNVF